MPSVAPDNHELILNHVYKYRRRIFGLVLFRVFIWSGTILIAGMGLSRFKLPGMLILTILVASSFAAYYLWHNYPRTEHVIRILDQRLSLKEGLVTAFQFSGSERHFVPLLIRQLSPRLTGARPHQIFPFKLPGVLLAWPFLLTLMIVPAETGPLRFFNFHQSQGDVESLKADAGDPLPEDIVNREESAIPSDRSPSARMYPVQQGVSDDGGQTEETDPSIPGLTKDDETHMPLRGTKEHENVIPAQAGIQNTGRGLDSHSPLTTGGDKLRGNDGHVEAFSSETLMSPGSQWGMKIEGRVIARAEGSKQSLNVAGFGIASHPPDARNDNAEGFSDETSMSRRLTKEDENKSSIPPAAGSLKGREQRNDRDEETIHAAVVQILTRQDIPQDYKEYVKSYFDVIQKEGQDHGEE